MALLIAFAVAALSYLGAIRGQLLPARPALVWLLALLPLAALMLGVRGRSRAAVIAAALELAACVPLHGLVTFLHAWRLD